MFILTPRADGRQLIRTSSMDDLWSIIGGCALVALLAFIAVFARPKPPVPELATRLREECGFSAHDVSSRARLTAALFEEAAQGNGTHLKLLVAAGADINVQAGDERATPLQVAVTKGNADLVERLIECKAAVNVPTATGKTALHMAAMQADARMIRALLAAGARHDFVDREGHYTALHLAAGYANPKDTDPVSLLIDAGANLDARDRAGATALDYAVAAKCVEVAAKLRAAGATTAIQREC